MNSGETVFSRIVNDLSVDNVQARISRAVQGYTTLLCALKGISATLVDPVDDQAYARALAIEEGRATDPLYRVNLMRRSAISRADAIADQRPLLRPAVQNLFATLAG